MVAKDRRQDGRGSGARAQLLRVLFPQPAAALDVGEKEGLEAGWSSRQASGWRYARGNPDITLLWPHGLERRLSAGAQGVHARICRRTTYGVLARAAEFEHERPPTTSWNCDSHCVVHVVLCARRSVNINGHIEIELPTNETYRRHGLQPNHRCAAMTANRCSSASVRILRPMVLSKVATRAKRGNPIAWPTTTGKGDQMPTIYVLLILTLLVFVLYVTWRPSGKRSAIPRRTRPPEQSAGSPHPGSPICRRWIFRSNAENHAAPRRR